MLYFLLTSSGEKFIERTIEIIMTLLQQESTCLGPPQEAE